MRRTALTIGFTLVVGIVVGVVGTQLLSAQQTGIKRTVLLKKDLTGIEGKEAVLASVELPAGASAGKHYHPGHELGYVLEGSAILMVEGQPPVTLNPGSTYHIDASRVHDAKNSGATAAKLFAVFIVEKGKPLTTPVQ